MTNEFKALVIAEAQALKTHATANELVRLDFNTVNPENRYDCIYGQMTGSCRSKRAVTLLKQCAPVAVPDLDPESEYALPSVFVDSWIDTFHWSPIETGIIKDRSIIRPLIAFLRNETQTLEI